MNPLQTINIKINRQTFVQERKDFLEKGRYELLELLELVRESTNSVLGKKKGMISFAIRGIRGKLWQDSVFIIYNDKVEFP